MENYFIFKNADYTNRNIQIVVDRTENMDRHFPANGVEDETHAVLDTDYETFTSAVKHARIFQNAYCTFYPNFDVSIVIL